LLALDDKILRCAAESNSILMFTRPDSEVMFRSGFE
jgi:hypothetical protein